MSLPFSRELSVVCQLLIPLSGKQDQLAWALPSVHSWGLPRAPEALGLFHTPASSLLPGTVFIYSFQWPAFLQTAGHQRGFASKCWLSKNYRKQTLDLEGSSETLESTPLTLPLGKLALENKGALEVAGTVMPWPISWAMFPLSLDPQRLVERGEPIPALQVAHTLWHKLAASTGQEKFTIHCGTLFRDTIRKSKSGRSCLSQTKSEPRSSRPKELS